MPPNENRVALAGAHPAGLGFVEQQSLTCAASKTQEQRRLQRQHLARQIHRLGARVLFELIDEIDRHHGLGADLDRRLERYANIDPAILAAVGADTFAPSPIRSIGGAR